MVIRERQLIELSNLACFDAYVQSFAFSTSQAQEVCSKPMYKQEQSLRSANNEINISQHKNIKKVKIGPKMFEIIRRLSKRKFTKRLSKSLSIPYNYVQQQMKKQDTSICEKVHCNSTRKPKNTNQKEEKGTSLTKKQQKLVLKRKQLEEWLRKNSKLFIKIKLRKFLLRFRSQRAIQKGWENDDQTKRQAIKSKPKNYKIAAQKKANLMIQKDQQNYRKRYHRIRVRLARNSVMAKHDIRSQPSLNPATINNHLISFFSTFSTNSDGILRLDSTSKERIILLNVQLRQDTDWTFQLIGKTGKIEKTKISTLVSCTCLEFRSKRNPCKHIYFIVSQVAKNEKILEGFVDNSKINDAAYNELIQNLYQRLEARLQNKGQEAPNRQANLQDEKDCMICFTQMNQTEDLQDCSACKKKFHSSCINKWRMHKNNCPVCPNQLFSLEEEMDSLSNHYER